MQVLVSALLLLSHIPPLVNGKGASLQKLDERCNKLLWLVGFQTQAETGSEIYYLADNKDYVDHLKIAILSANQNAPALIPIVILTGGKSGNIALTTWIENHGGYVLHHTLSFVKELQKMSSDPRWSYSQNLWGSWLRVDLAAIMSRVEKMMVKLARYGYPVPDYNNENILWTDPDVIFTGHIDSCTLPRPFTLSIGPEVGMGTAKNYGVIYFNLQSFKAMSYDMLAWAKRRAFQFEHDQDLLIQFLGDRVTALPDAFNWKLYWGNTTIARGPKYPGSGIKILHFHGPKLKLAICFFKKLKAFRRPYALRDDDRIEIVRMCGLKGPTGRTSANYYSEGKYGHWDKRHVALLAHILYNAFILDQGKFYFDAHELFLRYRDSLEGFNY